MRDLHLGVAINRQHFGHQRRVDLFEPTLRAETSVADDKADVIPGAGLGQSRRCLQIGEVALQDLHRDAVLRLKPGLQVFEPVDPPGG